MDGRERMGETMTAAEAGPRQETENELVEAWRVQELLRAGYDADSAAAIAGRLDIDLHYAVDMIRGGCDPDLALRILL
jgi:hypothetical protein